MSPFRMRISTLIALVLLAGSLAATARLADIEVALVFGGVLFVLGSLATGIFGIVYRSGERRAFWVGFTAFGWSVTLPFLLVVWISSDYTFALVSGPSILPFAWIGGVIARNFAARRPAPSLPSRPLHVLDRDPARYEVEEVS